MEETREDLSRLVYRLSRTVNDLERRVAALEGVESVPAPVTAPEGFEAEESALTLQGVDSLVPLFGWSLLGIAGAYLLRALTESGMLPVSVGAGAGVLYAAAWLLLAARGRNEKSLASAVLGVTAALILAPMLWEITVRFHVIGPRTASGVLVLFAVLGLAVGWRRNLTAIAWVVTLSGILTATALYRETHDAQAWVVTVLAIAAAVEFSACRDHWLSLRWVVALAADLVLLLLNVNTGVPAAFQLATQAALLAIYLSSTFDRTILRGLHITGFETGQAALAFLVSVGGALHLAQTSSGIAASVGACLVAGGIACYLLSFALLDRHADRTRDFVTYSTFALLLMIAGLRILLAGAAVTAAWSVLAVVLMAVGILIQRITLRIHAAVYLAWAVATAGLAGEAAGRIVRSDAGAGLALSAAYWIALIGAVVCYGMIVSIGKKETQHWSDPVEALFSAATAIWGIAGVAAELICVYLTGAAPLRTALLTAMAIVAAWAARRWMRQELIWLSYALIAAAGYKLLAEDFRQGQSLTLFVSLIFFGGALILLPRLLKRTAKNAIPPMAR